MITLIASQGDFLRYCVRYVLRQLGTIVYTQCLAHLFVQRAEPRFGGDGVREGFHLRPRAPWHHFPSSPTESPDLRGRVTIR